MAALIRALESYFRSIKITQPKSRTNKCFLKKKQNHTFTTAAECFHDVGLQYAHKQVSLWSWTAKELQKPQTCTLYDNFFI